MTEIDMRNHICRVGTARITYRGQSGQLVLDTTIKSGSAGLGAMLAPTWTMVMQFKGGEISWDTYRDQYTALMRHRYSNNPTAFLEALRSDELILCCYCRDTHATTKQCHRYILVDILEKIARHHGFEFTYIGEVYNSRR